MAEPGKGESIGRFNVTVSAESHFSWLRTRLSVERTLMAWVRTAIALIGFGFTIVQFFERMKDLPGMRPGHFPEAPRYFGLTLMLCGVVALVISVWEYRWTLHYLRSGDFAPIAATREGGKGTPLYAVAIVLILVGVFAVCAVLLRFV